MMLKIMFLSVCVIVGLKVNSSADDFYGRVCAGYGSLLKPDISEPGVNKGGVTAFFQALFGEDNFKYGAEFGLDEVYISWDKEKFVINKSLVLMPLLGDIEYDFVGGRITPYAGLSAGPYFALQGYTNATPDSSPASSSENVYGGVLFAGGRQNQDNKGL